MLIKPSSCSGCTLERDGKGFMLAEGQPRLGVTLMGEALGDEEVKQGGPFRGRAGFRFEKMIERAGYTRADFQILNAVWCQPPHNSIPPPAAVEKCRQYWEPLVSRPETKVIVPMGNTPLGAVLGEDGILSKRGYVWWSERYSAYVLPTVHPSYIMRGNSNWEAAWMYDLRHAVEIAQAGWEPITSRDLTLDPTPAEGWMWFNRLQERRRQYPHLTFLSADIETPDKSAAEDESDINLGYLPGPIHRIGFAYVDPLSGRTRALTVPWTMNYLELIQAILECGMDLVLCYRHFDFPRIKAHGLRVGPVRDVQEAWHILHSDLPKALEHITPFLIPNQPAWKHLNAGSTAAFYNATDACVQVEGMIRLKELLIKHGMWDLYEGDIHGLNPILLFMNERGMPIDQDKRKEASAQCMKLKEEVRIKLNDAAKDARPTKIYKKFREGLERIEIEGQERVCSECGLCGVSKTHAHVESGVARILLSPCRAVGFVQPLDFKPSQKGLIRYAQFKGYKLITRWDRDTQSRKITMDETAVRQYALKYEDDTLWPLALEERELNKLLGTYIGRLTDTPEPRRSEWSWTPPEKPADDDDPEIPF